jgi:translation initiation factor IF-2
VFVESFGGTVASVNISAKTGQGVEELLDMVLLLAEMEELKADPNKNAEGVIIEANLDPKRGISATLLIIEGTMKKGMFAASGEAMAPIRILEDFLGRQIGEASFSSPVRITGFSRLPKAGEQFKTFSSKKEAEDFVAESKKESAKIKPEKIIPKGEHKIIIPVVIKADVAGSLEAIEKELQKLSKAHTQILLNIIRHGVGSISKDDVKIASSGEGSIILGFNVKTESGVDDFAGKFEIPIKRFDIIYKLSEWLENEIGKRKEKSMEKEIFGEARILKIFEKKGDKQIVGGRVIKGKVENRTQTRIKRRGNAITQGKILSLQKGKEQKDEVSEGEEFGAMIESKIELNQGDELEIFGKIG